MVDGAAGATGALSRGADTALAARWPRARIGHPVVPRHAVFRVHRGDDLARRRGFPAGGADPLDRRGELRALGLAGARPGRAASARALAGRGEAAPRSSRCSRRWSRAMASRGWRVRCGRRCRNCFRPGRARRPIPPAICGSRWVAGEPTTVFVAHLDEIGFRITAIRDDGTLDAEAVGRAASPELWEGQPALVHTGAATVPASSCPATRPRRPGPRRASRRCGSTSARADRAASEALGVRVGHTVTSPKRYVRLLGARATGRSFDDRVGSTALVLARAAARPRAAPAHGDLHLERAGGDRPRGRRGRRRGARPAGGASTRHRHLRLGRCAARAA